MTTLDPFHFRKVRHFRVQVLPDTPTRSSLHEEYVSPAASPGIGLSRMDTERPPTSAIRWCGTSRSAIQEYRHSSMGTSQAKCAIYAHRQEIGAANMRSPKGTVCSPS